ncbi:hypothetical protein [Laspinema olomoucense]|uniref:hypothetical protein n=1 Tax=Laspinema olomoucense TaxID=3231600 RepID=UPI0021BAA659|nr:MULTISPECIES: hypothetical protein [unclassified Laspinema]MCT7975848.1 hypothetical protein [Laspinema sp. D3d]MCT7996586.1 hypothetical protein [Laspinema sp. D3c]
MSDIFISIRNQNGYAMTSVEGVAFIALVRQDNIVLDRQTVSLRYAMAQFGNVPPGKYIAVAFHESVNPPEATQEVTLAEDELLQVTFTYLEPERQLLRVFVQHYPFDMSSY